MLQRCCRSRSDPLSRNGIGESGPQLVDKGTICFGSQLGLLDPLALPVELLAEWREEALHGFANQPDHVGGFERPDTVLVRPDKPGRRLSGRTPFVPRLTGVHTRTSPDRSVLGHKNRRQTTVRVRGTPRPPAPSGELAYGLR
jgi:hypothetical protein